MSETIENVDANAAHLADLGHRARVALEKSDNMYITAGKYLQEAKGLCKEQGIKWTAYLKEHKIGTSKAAVCLAIADGRKTVDEVRKENADRQRKHQEKNKAAREAADEARNVDPDEDVEELDPHHAALMKALAKYIKTASTETLEKMAKVAKLKVE